MFVLENVTCGTITIDSMIPSFISNIIKVAQLVIPILLIIFGMLDLGKAVIANDDKEMKGAQQKLIKRIIYAVLVFFIIALVKFVFGLLADSSGSGSGSGSGNFTECIDCFLSGKCAKEGSE